MFWSAFCQEHARETSGVNVIRCIIQTKQHYQKHLSSPFITEAAPCSYMSFRETQVTEIFIIFHHAVQHNPPKNHLPLSWVAFQASYFIAQCLQTLSGLQRGLWVWNPVPCVCRLQGWRIIIPQHMAPFSPSTEMLTLIWICCSHWIQWGAGNITLSGF